MDKKEDFSPQIEMEGKVGIMSITEGIVDAILFKDRIWVPLERKVEEKVEKEVEETKLCNHCNKLKPVSEFYEKKNSSDGLQSWCKECMISYQSKKRELKRKKNKNQSQKKTVEKGVKKFYNCIKCGANLEVGKNWYESSKKYSRYICKDCDKKYHRGKESKKIVEKAKKPEPIKISNGDMPLVKVDATDRKSSRIKKNWNKFKDIWTS